MATLETDTAAEIACIRFWCQLVWRQQCYIKVNDRF